MGDWKDPKIELPTYKTGEVIIETIYGFTAAIWVDWVKRFETPFKTWKPEEIKYWKERNKIC